MPATTKHLAKAVEAAREALGTDSFDVVTIGFDVAQRHTAGDGRVRQAAGSVSTELAIPECIEGDHREDQRRPWFHFFPTPRGFDHINQSTIIDRDGQVYSQVYGVTFELPWLVEPLKELVFNRPSSAGHLLAGLDRSSQAVLYGV